MNFGTPTSRHNQPFDDRYIFDTLLLATTTIDFSYGYENMVIFVRDEKVFYFKNDGAAGTSVTHWTKLVDEISIFPPYNAGISYGIGDTASVGTNMYISIASNGPGQDPNSSPSTWLQVGATQKFTQSYTNQTSFVVNHIITNAVCSVYDDTTGVELDVLITRQSATTFLIQSDIPTSGLVIIS